jgi:hypothetical protein
MLTLMVVVGCIGKWKISELHCMYILELITMKVPLAAS